jgi:hypothetical protein
MSEQKVPTQIGKRETMNLILGGLSGFALAYISSRQIVVSLLLTPAAVGGTAIAILAWNVVLRNAAGTELVFHGLSTGEKVYRSAILALCLAGAIILMFIFTDADDSFERMSAILVTIFILANHVYDWIAAEKLGAN